jgi:hypothetical protein
MLRAVPSWRFPARVASRAYRGERRSIRGNLQDLRGFRPGAGNPYGISAHVNEDDYVCPRDAPTRSLRSRPTGSGSRCGRRSEREIRRPPAETKRAAAESVTRSCFGGLYASAALFLIRRSGSGSTRVPRKPRFHGVFCFESERRRALAMGWCAAAVYSLQAAVEAAAKKGQKKPLPREGLKSVSNRGSRDSPSPR